MTDVVAPREGRGWPVTTLTGDSVLLGHSQLSLRLAERRGIAVLEVRSRVDAGQCFHVPLDGRSVLAGLRSFTRLGRVHALSWALAFGVGPLPLGATVRFESGTLRHATSAETPAHLLARGCWVADARGVFARATLLAPGHEALTVPLDDRPRPQS